MPINRTLWKSSFNKTYGPNWPCPRCQNGTLKLKGDTLHFDEDAKSRYSHHAEGFGITDISLRFSALFECGQCRNIISCCGNGGYEPEETYGPDEGDYTEYFTPKYFSQHLIIFRAPQRCPKPIKEQLYLSFSVFFYDLSAAANHVRSCVEEIITDLGVPVLDKNGKPIALHNRITMIKEKDQDNAERSLASKWIGNFGSHIGKLTKDNLLDAYDILEVLLEDIYVGHYRSVKQKVHEINKNKGPLRE